MFFSANDVGEMTQMVYNWEHDDVDAVVVTDGSRYSLSNSLNSLTKVDISCKNIIKSWYHNTVSQKLL